MAKAGPWRKIVQWIAGVFFVGMLAAALVIGGFARLSAPQTAKPLLSTVFKEALLQTELAQKFEQFRPMIKNLPPEEPLPIPGFPKFAVTAGEAANMNVDELAGRIATEAASNFYEGKLDLPPEAGLDLNSFGPLGALFSAKTHQSVANLGIALWALTIIMGAIMVAFSRRFGRLSAPGIGLMAGSFVPLLVYAIAAAKIEGAAKLSDAPSMEMRLLAPMLKQMESAVTAGRGQALQIMLAGVALLAVAIVGGVASRKLSAPDQPSS